MRIDISTYGIKQLYQFVKTNNELRSIFVTAKSWDELYKAVDKVMIFTPLQLTHLKQEFDKHFKTTI